MDGAPVGDPGGFVGTDDGAPVGEPGGTVGCWDGNPVGEPGGSVGIRKNGGIPSPKLGLSDGATFATGDLITVDGKIDGASDGSNDGVFSPRGTVGNKDSAWAPKDGTCETMDGAVDGVFSPSGTAGTNDGTKSSTWTRELGDRVGISGELRTCNCGDEESQDVGGSDDSMHIEARINGP